MDERLTGDGDAADAMQIVTQQITAGASESPLEKGGCGCDRDELEQFEDRMACQPLRAFAADDDEQSSNEWRFLVQREHGLNERRFLDTAQFARLANVADRLSAVVDGGQHGEPTDFGAMAPLPEELRASPRTY